MRAVVALAAARLRSLVRERESLFWLLIFPVALLLLLVLIFGSLGEEGQMSFSVALVNRDEGQAAAHLEAALAGLGQPVREGQPPLFDLSRPGPGEDVADFLAREREAVVLGDRTLLIVIPPGFSQQVLLGLAPTGRAGPVGLVQIYYSEGNAAAGFALNVVEQVVTGFNRELLAQAGLYRREAAVPAEVAWVGGGESPIAYVDFLLPGMVLMAFFVGGLFDVPGTILFARDQRVLRRYWVTPLTVRGYLAGFALGHVGLCVVQFALLFVIGRFGLGAEVELLRPGAIGYLALTAATSLAFGFLVASVVKTANAGMALANVVNMPMLFLSGVFFPVADLPGFLLPLLYANPLTYLAQGLRTSLGVGQETLPQLLTVVVPAAWILLSAAVAGRRLSWDVGR
ncbi:MAG: ABC transporter permease [Candidatus Bipolaricaulaceae bacterium]